MADAVEKRRAAEPVASPAVRKPSAYGGRFALAHLLVVLVFGGLMGAFVYLVAGSRSSEAWSSYKPTGATYRKAQNMANHVAPRYVSGGTPIAVVQAQPLIYRDAVVDGIAFTRAPFRNVGTHYTQFESASKTMLYVFCGQAARCGLAESGAEDVIPLLRRESLELALYTFKYSPDVSSIVTLLPLSGNSSAAVFLRRRHVEKFLRKPLDATLPQHSELTAESLTDTERQAIAGVIVKNTFISRFEQAPNGRTVLLLDAVTR